MAHARRKFHELHVTGKSQVAEQALVLIQKLYAIEAELRKKTASTAEDRREYRQQHSQPVMQQLYEWLNQHDLAVPSSSPTAKAINYTLKRWSALSRYLDDGNLPRYLEHLLESSKMYVLPEKRHRLCPRVVKAKPAKYPKKKCQSA